MDVNEILNGESLTFKQAGTICLVWLLAVLVAGLFLAFVV